MTDNPTPRLCGDRGCTEPAYRCDGCGETGCMDALRKACRREGWDAGPWAEAVGE